jgi:hypothetical protein
MNTTTLPPTASETSDSGRIRVGGSARYLPRPTAPAAVADTGRIRAGGSARPA